MTELERQELEQLKTRHGELLRQVGLLGHRLDIFEKRLADSPSTAVLPPTKAPAVAPAPILAPPLISKPQPLPPAPQPIRVAPRAHALPEFLTPAPASPQSSATAPTPEPFGKTAQTKTPPTPPPAKKASFEMRLGTFWLVRIGIVMLLTSLVFFGSYAYQNFVPRLGPAGKITLLYLAGGGLLAAGAFLQRKRETMRNYAQVLLAGGFAAVYFTTYAAHHIPNLQVISSAVWDGVLLCGWAGFMIWIADRAKSEVMALLAVLLAYYASIITHAGLFTLYSNLVLTLAAVVFLVRNRWATATFASLVATYASYSFWRFFHSGHWQWATPGEGLWTGNYFLMGYWLLFTAAAFLSKHEQFNGGRRATFLSLNNGAFFSAFLLTMLQVHQGGFWKFSLAYGALLLLLAVLAGKVLPGDQLFRNTYLTQGLLLATLGFVTYTAGLKLCLVLGVESVILLLLGGQLKNRVMQTSSLIAAALACGWAVMTLQPLDHNSLATGAALGCFMLWNAFCLRRKTTFADSVSHARTVFYTVLALALWLLVTWQNVAEPNRCLLFACESAVFLLAARPFGNRTLQLGSYLFAGVSLGCEFSTLGPSRLGNALALKTGLPEAILTGALLLFNALWERRKSRPDSSKTFHLPVTYFCALSLLGWLLTTAAYAPHDYALPVLALEALLLTAAYYPTRLKETAIFGQAYLIFAQVIWLATSLFDPSEPPAWNAVVIIAVTLALAAWWQRQKAITLGRPLLLALQGLYALAVVGLLYFWLQPQFTEPVWLAFTCVLAVLLTAYAALNRYWLLAAAGQIFVLVSCGQFAHQLLNGKPEWYLPLAPIATLCLLSFCAIKWFEARPGVRAEVRQPILGLGLAYRMLALAMSLCWVQNYIPVSEHTWVLSALGLLLFLMAGWRRSHELLIFAAVFTLAGLAKFWFPLEGAPTVYWPNALALLVLLGQEQFAKRWIEKYRLPWQIHAAVIILGGLSLWLYTSRLILERTTGFYLTVGWSGLALILFLAGMLLRERVYRWLGLVVLACALGRVVVFDVWKLQAIYQILSFMALGIVLLLLGFIYNRYQEKIREWL